MDRQAHIVEKWTCGRQQQDFDRVPWLRHFRRTSRAPLARSLAQAQKNAIIFFRLWVFCYRSHANDFTLIAYLHELSSVLHLVDNFPFVILPHFSQIFLRHEILELAVQPVAQFLQPFQALRTFISHQLFDLFRFIFHGSQNSYRAKLKLLQEPHIVFVKEADIVDAVTDHGDAFDAKAERPAGPDFGVVTDNFKDRRMHDATAGDLGPVLAHLFHQRAGEINFIARLGVAEIVRTKTNLHVLAQQFLENEFDRALEVADGDAWST